MNPLLKVSLVVAVSLVASQQVLALASDRHQQTVLRCERQGKADGKSGTFVGEGNCSIVKGSLVINADKLFVEKKDEISVYIVEGSPATFQQQPEEGAELIVGKGNRIEYRETSGKLLLIGNAFIDKGDTYAAERVEYDSARETVDLEGPLEIIFPPAQTDNGNN